MQHVREEKVNAAGEVELRCTKCAAWKEREKFRRIVSKRSRCGRNSWCTACEHERHTERARERRAEAAAAAAARAHASNDPRKLDARWKDRLLSMGLLKVVRR